MAGQSTQDIPFIRGAGGHEIFLRLPPPTRPERPELRVRNYDLDRVRV
jgi:hypothetical protein